MSTTLKQTASSVVGSLSALQVIVDERDPLRSPRAQEALELVATQLTETGMLDILITIAARQMTESSDTCERGRAA